MGAEGIYHSAPERTVQAWLAMGLGYDALRATYRQKSSRPTFGDAGPVPIRGTGFELGHVQLGIDFALVPAFTFGPFLVLRWSLTAKYRGIQDSADCSVWSSIGLKAALRL